MHKTAVLDCPIIAREAKTPSRGGFHLHLISSFNSSIKGGFNFYLANNSLHPPYKPQNRNPQWFSPMSHDWCCAFQSKGAREKQALQRVYRHQTFQWFLFDVQKEFAWSKLSTGMWVEVKNTPLLSQRKLKKILRWSVPELITGGNRKNKNKNGEISKQ